MQQGIPYASSPPLLVAIRIASSPATRTSNQNCINLIAHAYQFWY